MPRQLHQKLMRRARKMKAQGRLKGDVEAYVYGTMHEIEEKKKKRTKKRRK